MNKNSFFLFISWIIFLNPPIIEGAVAGFSVDETYFESVEIRNPFSSQLPKKEDQEPPAPVAADVPVKPAVAVQAAAEPVIQPRREEWKPPPAPEIPLPVLNITGLIWDTDRPQAIVNGQIVEVGDTVLGARITAIQKTGLDVLFNGKKFSIGR